ncbi:MAG: hypothetical protein ABWZ82_12130 [Candidatus Limnocylindrales bacterium]
MRLTAGETGYIYRVTTVAMDRRTFLRATGLSLAGVASAGWAAGGLAPGAGATAAQATAVAIDELAASLDYDQERIFRFVADEIAYEPYAGILRGPHATLTGRAGSAADKAVLLAELLHASLLTTRFVVGMLDDAAADGLARTTADPAAVRRRREMALAGGARSTSDAPLAPEVRAIVDRLPEIDAAVTSWAATTLDTSATTIVSALAGAGITVPAAPGPLPLLERSHHVWVQVRFGSDWLDLDSTLPGTEPGGRLATQDAEPTTTPPDDLRHRIDIDVVVERIRGDALEREVVIEHTLFADEVTDAPIAFGHARPEGLKALGGGLAQLLDGGVRYQAVLQAGETSYIATSSVLVSGGGGGVFDIGETASRDGEATAEWLDITITAPGGRTRSIQRVVFDRIGDAVRQAGTIDLASVPAVELPRLGPAAAPEYPPLCAVYFISIATGLSRRPTVPAGMSGEEARVAAALGIPAAMHHVTRDTTNAVLTLDRGVAVHLDAPNLTMHSYIPVVDGDGSVRVRESLDLLHRSFGVLPVAGIAPVAPPGILAGVASHVAERLRMGEGLPADLAMRPAPIGPGAIVERAITDGTGLIVIRADVPQDASYPAAIVARLQGVLAEGWVAVGPRRPVMVDGEARLGWWLVDPVTGATVDMADDGRGVAMVEWAIDVVVVMIVAVVAFVCVGSASRAAAWNAEVAELQGIVKGLGGDVPAIPPSQGACG